MKSNEEDREQSERPSGAPPEIASWLEKLGLERYASAFIENDIDFTVLRDLSDADLRELGVGSLGHRKRLLAAIEARGRAPPQTTVERVAAPQGERRQVTILFADLSGFTALSRSLDAEQVHEVVARFTSRVDGVIVGYDGSIDKHIGDAVMALFGARVPMTTIRCEPRERLSISMKPWLDRTRIPLTLSRRILESRAAKSSPER